MDKRYIDADKLWEEIDNEDIYTDFESACIFKMVREKIKDAPTADVEEVRHGKWEVQTEPLGWQEVECAVCSVCGDSVVLTDSDMDIDDIRNWWNYCPNCGARMQKEKEE